MANAVTPTSWFYTLYVHTPSSITQRDNPSRLEIAFLLDSGASIYVLNYPTYTTLTKLLDIRPNHTSDIGTHNTSKTLTVANQTEVPILHYANIILITIVRAKTKRIKAFKCVAYAKKERKICFQGSVKYRRVDRTVWNHFLLLLIL